MYTLTGGDEAEKEAARQSWWEFFDAGSEDVWTVKQSPATGTLREAGEPGSSSVVTYESTLHFDSLGELAIPASNRELEVDTSVDLGHGSVELPIRMP